MPLAARCDERQLTPCAESCQLDPNELEQAFRRHAESLDVSCAAAPSRFIAIDGKTLRQSFVRCLTLGVQAQ
ncbi:hypothetical protein [Methylocystis rosea]|uniref:hypothetical protein n=1 Tax=Methylocystis rosea TaxID=173366 RepID=UPI0003AABEE2|nr:hypothetical protein [Methylocystis rosea]